MIKTDTDTRDSSFFHDKMIDMDKELKKVVEICQAMLVYSKDKHFQTLQLEDELNSMILKQQDQESQRRASNNFDYKEIKANREE